MARFGRDFVRAATQPAYLEGLFTAAQGLGAAPAKRRQVEEYRKLDPMQRIEYDLANARTAEDIRKAQAAKTAFMQTESQKAINKLEAARASSDDPDLQREYERSMAGIAANAGLDARGYVGRTDAEDLRRMQTEAIQDAATERQRAQQTRAITAAYKSLLSREDLDETAVENFKRVATEAQFGDVIDSVDRLVTETANREITHQNLLDARAEKQEYLSSTSPVGTLEKQIDESDLSPSLKKVLKGRLERLKENYPDFSKKETWTPAGRKLHDSEYKAVSDSFFREVSSLETTKAREATRLVKLRDNLAKIAGQTRPKSEWAEYTKEAETQLRVENNVSSFTPSRLDGIDEQQINQRAMAIATRRLQENMLKAVNAARIANDLEALTLEEVLGTDLSTVTPTEVPEPAKETETVDFTKADEIAGV